MSDAPQELDAAWASAARVAQPQQLGKPGEAEAPQRACGCACRETPVPEQIQWQTEDSCQDAEA